MLSIIISETFWSRDVTDIQVLAHFKLKIYTKIFELIKSLCAELFQIFWNKMSQNRTRKMLNLSSLYVLNCFQYFQIYILGHLFQKNQTRKKFELCQND